ncbi:hypothetical protein GN956_G3586 [Arapaima gigas]
MWLLEVSSSTRGGHRIENARRSTSMEEKVQSHTAVYYSRKLRLQGRITSLAKPDQDRRPPQKAAGLEDNWHQGLDWFTSRISVGESYLNRRRIVSRSIQEGNSICRNGLSGIFPSGIFR